MSVKPKFLVTRARRINGTLPAMRQMHEIERLLRRGDASAAAVGHRLKLIRLALDKKQREMALIFKTSVNNYQQCEYGRQYPQPFQIQNLMNETGCDHNLVFAGRASAMPPAVALYLANAPAIDEAG